MLSSQVEINRLFIYGDKKVLLKDLSILDIADTQNLLHLDDLLQTDPSLNFGNSFYNNNIVKKSLDMFAALALNVIDAPLLDIYAVNFQTYLKNLLISNAKQSYILFYKAVLGETSKNKNFDLAGLKKNLKKYLNQVSGFFMFKKMLKSTKIKVLKKKINTKRPFYYLSTKKWRVARYRLRRFIFRQMLRKQ